jgi:hypothetical protein
MDFVLPWSLGRPSRRSFLILPICARACAGWTGWTFDKQLFPYPEDTLGYLKSRGLLLAANLHDAQGVGNWDRQYEPLAKVRGDLPPLQVLRYDVSSRTMYRVSCKQLTSRWPSSWATRRW